MNPIPIKIYEFSTAIDYEIDFNGNIISKGFSTDKSYINQTIATIPPNVDKMIKAGGFDVVKEKQTNMIPALVGRVVLRENDHEQDWSVIAVVTPGQDDRGRRFMLSRYFLCQGHDNLWKLVSWIEDIYKETYHQYPVFNSQNALPESCFRHINRYEYAYLKQHENFEEIDEFVNKPSNPAIVFINKRLSHLKIINLIAEQKGKLHGISEISWAYNVDYIAEEYRQDYLVIQPADEEAYTKLITVKRRNNFKNNDLHIPLHIKKSVENAIKILIEDEDNYHPELISTLIESKDKLTSDQWQELFEYDLGVDLSKENPQPKQIKKITLMPLLSPKSLIAFLDWLESDNFKDSNRTRISLNFQDQLTRCYENRLETLTSDIVSIIDEVLKYQGRTQIFAWLLNNPRSLWNSTQTNIVNHIHENLKNYKTSSRNLYLSIFLEELKEYKLAAYFEQINRGLNRTIDSALFYKAFPKHQYSESSQKYLNLNISRRRTLREILIDWIPENMYKVAQIILLSLFLFAIPDWNIRIILICFALLYWLTEHVFKKYQLNYLEVAITGFLTIAVIFGLNSYISPNTANVADNNNNGSGQENVSEENSPSANPEGTTTDQSETPPNQQPIVTTMGQTKFSEAVNAYPTTNGFLNQIIIDLKNENFQQEEIVQAIYKVVDPELTILKTLPKEEKEKENFVRAIYNYQEQKEKDGAFNFPPDGLITSPESATFKTLKKEVKEELTNQ